MPATPPAAAADWTRKAAAYGPGYDADEQAEYLAWSESIEAGFPEPELTPERDAAELMAAFGMSEIPY
jgi:hypothetical protein